MNPDQSMMEETNPTQPERGQIEIPKGRHVLGHVSHAPSPGHIRGARMLGRHLAHVTEHRGELASHLVNELKAPRPVEAKRHFTRPVAPAQKNVVRQVGHK